MNRDRTAPQAFRIAMPPLQQGRIYAAEEVQSLFTKTEGECDFELLSDYFPFDPRTFGRDPERFQEGEKIYLQHWLLPMKHLRGQAEEFGQRPDGLSDFSERTAEIQEGLLRGEVALPLFVQRNDPQFSVIAGAESLVALLRLESDRVPAFLLGYRNWFAR